jgi:Contractile injection system tape measure protein
MDKTEELTFMKEVISIKNAGLVLLNSYLPLLFEKINLTKDRKFLNTASRSAAVNHLQYLAAGSVNKDAPGAQLSKLLCGMDMDETVTGYVDITDTNKQLIEGLIKAAIAHWPAIGQTSVDGFRGNWLVRNGTLSAEEDKWELTVERRAYDILINQSPFSFSIIKYPWMEKPLHVNWSF